VADSGDPITIPIGFAGSLQWVAAITTGHRHDDGDEQELRGKDATPHASRVQ
jgi:hypothetical protein